MGKKSLTNIVAFIAAFFVTACFMLSGCSSEAEKYASVIPGDADFVFKIDGKSIFAKAGIDNAKTEKILTKAGVKEEFAKDPAKMGIDLREPMFAFFNIGNGNDFNGGLVCKVLDQKNLINFLQTQNKSIKFEDKNGINFAKNHDTGIAIYGETALFLAGRSGEIEDQAVKMFSAPKEASFTKSKMFSNLCDNKKDISGFFSFKSIEKLPGYKPSSFTSLPNISAEDLKSINLIGGVSFETGEIDTDFDVYSENENVIKLMKEQATKISGDYLNLFSDDCLLFLTGSTKPSQTKQAFDAAIENLKAEGLNFEGEEAEMINTIRDIFCGIDGDIAFSASMTNDGIGGIPLSVNFAAHTNDNKMFESAASLLNKFSEAIKSNGGEINKTNDNTYMINLLGKNIAMGMDKNSFYFTTAGEASKMFGQSQGTKHRIKGDIKSCNGFYYFNIKPLMPFAQMYGRELATVASEFDNIHMISDTDNHATARIMMTNEKENSLKVIFNLIEKFVEF